MWWGNNTNLDSFMVKLIQVQNNDCLCPKICYCSHSLILVVHPAYLTDSLWKRALIFSGCFWMLRIWDFACSSSSPFRFAAGVLERAAFKSRFSNSSGFRSGLYWKEFVFLLLESMPSKTAEHYRNKIAVYLCWWMTKGGKPDGIPDECERDLISEDLYPSWRRICKCILKND